MIKNLEEVTRVYAEYIEIDWVKTGDNLRTLLFKRNEDERGQYVKAVAKALHISERSIHYWLSGADPNHHPNIEVVLLLSGYLGVLAEDIIEIRGDRCGKTAWEILQAFGDLESEGQCSGDAFSLEQGFLLNEVYKREYPITTLFDFLLYLPLIPEDVLRDFLNRVQGDVYGDHQRFYIFDQLRHCYGEIENLVAKKYADSKRERMSKRPNCFDWNDKTKDEGSIEKFEKDLRLEFDEAIEASRLLSGRLADLDLAAPFLAYAMEVNDYASGGRFTDAERAGRAKSAIAEYKAKYFPDE